MKATLTFDLPDEREEFMYAQRGIGYAGALDELDREMRDALKYESGDITKLKGWSAVTEYWRTRLNELKREAEE